MTNAVEIQDFARQFAQYTNRNIFLTGKAGTGKTTFLHHLREITGKQIAVVAPTGVAAINAAGTTIHSFFQLPFTPFIPTEFGKKELISKLKMQSRRRNVIRELELLVIDEVSMVRADVLDAIDTVLRHIRYRFNEPFGGVQVLFIGDLYQLSPVAKSDEWQILSQFYSSIYFFHSQVMLQNPPVYIEFEKIFRQQDMNFIGLLNEIRNNTLTENGLKLLKSCYNPSFIPPKNENYIILTTHNYKADAINTLELSKLKGKSEIFRAKITGDFPEKSFPIDENLEMKKGAKVMFIKNDTENPRRFFNGKIGEIIDFEEDVILVKCPEDDEEIEVTRMTWENIRYKTDETTTQINEEILGTFTQFPLRLAWAITIHKSQGLTFDKAIIDAGDAFAAGQVYVALSRCRSLEGMVLKSEIDKYSLQNEELIVRYSSQNQSIEVLSQQLDISKRNFHDTLLVSIFDFRQLINTANFWKKETKDIESSFDNDTFDFIQNVILQISEIQNVGLKFQEQVNQICKMPTVDADFLTSRLKAASEYFTQKLHNLSETLHQSPATTDSKQSAKIYDEGLIDIFTLSEQKKHYILGISNGFDVDKYFILKNSFRMPSLPKTSYSKNSNKEKLVSKNPQLMNRLFQLRNDICDSKGLPIYIVAGTRTIKEMSDYLPQNKEDILRIHGFGDAKYEKYGEVFLKCITDYCSEKGLKSAMQELFDTEKPKRERKPKPQKGESAKITLQSYLDGMSISEIAKERNLVEGTIAGHLAKMVEIGFLKIDRFISKEEQKEATKILETNESDESPFSILSAAFDQQKAIFLTAWIRGGRKEGKV